MAALAHTPPGDACWHTIGVDDRPVPTRHLRPLFLHEREDIVDDWAARIFHGHLFTTARVQTLIDVEIGRALARLARLDGFITLGYATMGDYVRETLGLGVRWAQELVRLAGALERLPALERALLSGTLTTTKVLALLPVVTEENVAAWETFAARSTVRALRDAVREGCAPEGGEVEGPDANTAGNTANGADVRTVTIADTTDDDTERIPLTLRVPAVVADLFEHTLDVVRRRARGHIPRREAFAYMLGELAAAVPLDDAPDAGRTSAPDPVRAATHRHARREQLEAMLERLTRAWSFLHDPPERIRLDPALATAGVPPDAFALDAHLEELAALRQRRHLDLGALLYNICLAGLPRKMCFASLGHYARERLGLSGRTAQETRWAYRRLFHFPQLRAAYEAREIGWSHLRLLLRIVRPSTEAAWIARARGVTFRRFECEVAAAHRHRAVDPLGWARDGHPGPLTHEPPYAERSPVRPGHGLWEETTPPTGGGDETKQSRGSASPLARTFAHARWVTIRLELPADTFALWQRARATLRRRLEPADGAASAHVGPFGPSDWHCLVEICRVVLETWESRAPRTLAERVVARDGECCTVPGCTCRASHEAHHVVLRSRPGSTDTLDNLTTVCARHHAHGLHAGRIRCTGNADEGIRWELGLRTGHAPRRVYVGDVRMDG